MALRTWAVETTLAPIILGSRNKSNICLEFERLTTVVAKSSVCFDPLQVYRRFGRKTAASSRFVDGGYVPEV
jgi:hypothetical protein